MRKIIIILFVLIIPVAGFCEELQEQLDKYQAAYNAGVQAKTLFEQQEAFNQALQLLVGLEVRHHPVMGNGKIFYNLGNIDYLLGIYPWAAYSYYRALELNPRHEATRENLKETLNKLGLSSEEQINPFESVFFFYYQYSLPERLQAFFFLGMLFLGLASLWIWLPQLPVKGAVITNGLLLVVLGGTLLYSAFMAPEYGVLVKAAMVRKDAGSHYATVKDDPLPAGLKVEVLEHFQGRQWLKIQTNQGIVGYVNTDAIRLI